MPQTSRTGVVAKIITFRQIHNAIITLSAPEGGQTPLPTSMVAGFAPSGSDPAGAYLQKKHYTHTNTHTHAQIHTHMHTHTHAHAFIHSLFITEIYIAPLQGYYSEALPTLARLNRRVLRLE